MARVYFIGAGPGDPELLTLKARRLIGRAGVIIYADSLVNPDILAFASKRATIYKSASRTLEKTTEIIVEAVRRRSNVVRLQSGDPSIYGAIAEQMALLDAREIDYEVVPGVSSLFAAAALLKSELTSPGVCQTIIITRKEGRTTVPPMENLRSLASHNATMALFLSAGQAAEVAANLIAGGYSPDTPAAVVYRAGWKDQSVTRTTLRELPMKVAESGITRQALILVGQALGARGPEKRSRLYDPDFKHGYRE